MSLLKRTIALMEKSRMKRFFALASVLAFSCCLHAQAVDTTVCDILKDPQAFNGKIVRVKGTVSAGFDQFVIKGAGCKQRVSDIWLSYPEGTKAKAGPAAVLELQPAKNFTGTVAAVERTPVQLDKNNKDFKQFDSWLSTFNKGDGLCLGCRRYTVTATLVGRLDGVAAGLKRDKAGKIVSISGFGNLNAYSARLVLQSVSDLTSQEIDYSKSAAATKGDVLVDALGTDAVANAHKVATVFGPGNPLGERMELAAAAFGKQGGHNGVELSFGAPNQALAKADAKGNSDSPDGVLFNCQLDTNRLKGAALSIAIAYAGTLINDLREPQKADGRVEPYELEYYAWQSVVVGAIGNRLKTLTAPGGYLLWKEAWTLDERTKLADEGIKGFLANEALLSR
jgi:hypothetical protein